MTQAGRPFTDEVRSEHAHARALALSWLSALLGLPQGTTGTFAHDAESANLKGLACAKYRMLNGHAEGLVYCSQDTDPMLERVMRRLGFAEGSVRRLPSVDGRLGVFALLRKVREDRLAGRCPFCVVANAGTEDTGAVDNLILLAQLCKAEGLWLHVDGSRGACAAMTERGHKLLRGLAGADSLALDLQQALMQPHPLGCLLLRDCAALDDTLRSRDAASTFDEAAAHQDERAVTLWSMLKACGAETFRQEADRRMRLADRAEAEIRKHAGWQIMSRSQLGVVTFRFKPAGASECEADRLQAGLAKAAHRKGLILLDTARPKGRLALRLCTNHRAIDEPDVQVTLQWLLRQAAWLQQQVARDAPHLHREDVEPADTTI
jgi:aromatic-L-amino-acid/L-tryptophan decarboxylase